MGDFQRRIGGAAARFMYGRNGWDQLNRALFTAYAALLAVRLVLGAALHVRRPARICEALMLALLAVMLVRMFSRNLSRRRAENQRWLNWCWHWKRRSEGARARRADRDHKYFTCRQCHTICRVPAGKGTVIITCPKCGAQRKART